MYNANVLYIGGKMRMGLNLGFLQQFCQVNKTIRGAFTPHTICERTPAMVGHLGTRAVLPRTKASK